MFDFTSIKEIKTTHTLFCLLIGKNKKDGQRAAGKGPVLHRPRKRGSATRGRVEWQPRSELSAGAL